MTPLTVQYTCIYMCKSPLNYQHVQIAFKMTPNQLHHRDYEFIINSFNTSCFYNQCKSSKSGLPTKFSATTFGILATRACCEYD